MRILKILMPVFFIAGLTACDTWHDNDDYRGRAGYRDRSDWRDRSDSRDQMKRPHRTYSSGMGGGGYSGASAATRDQTSQPYPGGPADTGPKGPVYDNW